MNGLGEIRDQLTALWRNASPLHRALAIVGIASTILGIGYFATLSDRTELVPLANQSISIAQVGRITAELEKRQAFFRVTQDGQQVLVPRHQRGDLLASLASVGVSTRPETSNPLQPGLLTTDFQQRELIRQDLERSLARDITSMSAIEWAEVHISPGTDSLFTRRNRRGTASVIIKIRPGFSLPKERAASLKNLVAQAAHRYGVTNDSVTVVDDEARTLAAAEDDSDLSANAKALSLQRETEDDLANRIHRLLEPIVGVGRVRVQVRTRMNLNLVEEHAEQYDPDNATILSERKTSETARSQRQDSAIAAGARGNIPQKRVPRSLAGGSRTNRGRAVNETKFAVPKITKHTRHAIGSIQRMSIAVVVDAGAFLPPTEDSLVPPSSVQMPARPNQSMLLALVRDAVAFDEARGDSITLSFQPFVRPLLSDRIKEIDSTDTPPSVELSTLVPILMGAALLGLIFYYAYRYRSDVAAKEAHIAHGNSSTDIEEGHSESQRLDLKTQVRQITVENLPATVDVIKGWLSTTANKASKG
ncbi:MAG: flagellar basal-body MS-ring/collar protein FliF [Myxococcota bacterium]